MSNSLDQAPLVEMLRKMTLIRCFERRVHDLYLRGVIPGTIHTSEGQEAVPVGVSSVLRQDDAVFPTHRGHGHALAKGMDPEALFAELFAREGGCCRGKAGSMHIADVAKGIMPANPIVASSMSVANGVAFAFKRKGEDRVAVSYFGDGAANAGPFHETLNLASIWKLPVVFVCENNQYAISTRWNEVTAVERISDRADAYSIPGITVDGNDVAAVYEAAAEAVQRARDGEGPTLLECFTYRWGGHKRDDPADYRPDEEEEGWRERDPVSLLRANVLRYEVLTQEEIEEIENTVEEQLETAVKAAMDSPGPDPDVALADVYA